MPWNGDKLVQISEIMTDENDLGEDYEGENIETLSDRWFERYKPKDGHPVLGLLVFSVFRYKRPDQKDWKDQQGGHALYHLADHLSITSHVDLKLIEKPQIFVK